VRRWRSKFEAGGVDAVGSIAPGRGRKPEIAQDVIDAIIEDTLHTVPDDGATAWSTRTMAERHGVGKDTVASVWKARQLRPWRIDTFKLSNDPAFESKLVDVVGLYLDPPERAAVFSFDEKTQCQALDRTQPSLPLKAGRGRTMTHDYKRNGTTSLYAALEIATGEVTGACYPRHRHQEFLAFLNQLVRAYPRVPLHVVLDNSSTHSTPEVERWLARHKRVHFHFTPTGASWMNMVEIFFSILTNQQVRRGVYHDVPELIAAIEYFIEHYNQRAQPFVWTKTADEILNQATRSRRSSLTRH
jgi:transposase